MTKQTRKAYLSSVALSLVGLSPALAQDDVVQVRDDELASEPALIEEMIVTGRAGGGSQITQFESTVSITTFGEEKLREIAPLTLSDVFAQVPGVWAETSGGEAASNVFVRGIPAPGQFLFSKIAVDGLPVFEENGAGFLTPDGFVRIDETIQRVEAIRGGSSSIFASNAPGGVFNHITRRGTDVPEGVIKGEWGNFNRFRADAFYSGPISDDTVFSIGGFYRVDDGVRDPGFRANDGGQIRGSVTKRFDLGEVTVTSGYINERNIFYLPIPLGLDSDGDFVSVEGLDANFGTLVSDDNRALNYFQGGGGVRTFDLADGIHNEHFNIGLEIDLQVGEWYIVNRSRYVTGQIDFNTQIAATVENPEDFLANQEEALFSSIAAGAFDGTADAAFNDTASLALQFSNGDPFLTGNNGNGLVGTSLFFSTLTDLDNFQNDFQVGREVEFFGIHNVTLGVYASTYNVDQTQLSSNNVHEIDNSPETLDVLALNAEGDVIGTVTQNSFLNFGNSVFENYFSEGDVFAVYLSDEWNITEDLRLDFGFRYESVELNGSVEVPGTFNLTGDNPLLPEGALPTLADNSIVAGTGELLPFQQTYGEFAYSIGANYEFTDWLAMYARVSDGYRTPTVDDLAALTLTATSLIEDGLVEEDSPGEFIENNILVNDIFQVEGGFKISLPYVQAFVTGFFSQFDDSTFTESVEVPGMGLQNVTLIQSSDTLGLEAEALFGPFYGFSMNGKITLQRPEFNSFSFLTPLPGGLTPEDVVGDVSGNAVNRIAERIFIIRPEYEFELPDLYGLQGDLFFEIFNVDSRFSDAANTIILPGYTKFSAGLAVDLLDNIQLTVIGDNLTNTIGLTEGNPRTDTLAGPVADASIATFGRPIVGRNVRLSVAYRF
ncbi:MAG: TonB-dependent receptor [Rhodothalassiaceae bacterium]